MKYSTIAKQFDYLTDYINRELVKELTKNKLTLRQFEYIKIIADDEFPTISKIAAKLQFKKPTVTIAINELITKGLLAKKQNSKDKRFFYLKLTRKGKNLLQRIDERNKEVISKLLENLTSKDVKYFSWILQKIVNEIEILGK